MKARFARFAQAASEAAGSPWAFLLAALVVVGWFVAGFVVGFTDSLQLVINTGTTIVTFLMVFLIQAAQNRNEAAIQAKLDELVRAVDTADDRLVGIEKEV